MPDTQIREVGGELRGATLSHDERYRFHLFRDWAGGESMANKISVTWVMLNPSTGDGLDDDPTIRRCRSFSQRLFRADRMEIVNLRPERQPKSSVLFRNLSPLSELVDDTQQRIARTAIASANFVVAAWGTNGSRLLDEVDKVKFWSAGLTVYCLGKTNMGHPVHPLYLPADVIPEVWYA